MSPTVEYIFKKALVGLARGWADAVDDLHPQLRRPAAAYQRAAADTRAVRHVRRMALDFGQEPDGAELRYWSHIDAGLTSAEAAQVVSTGLKRL